MFTHLMDVTKGFLFWGIAMVLTITVSLLAPLFGEAGTMFLHMYTPTIAVVLMLLVTRDGYVRSSWRSLGVQRLGLPSWWLALVGPVVIVGAVYGLVWSIGIARPSLPPGANPALVPLDFLIQLGIASVFALGEEIGFRGYLLPRLMSLGTTRALLLSGLLHGIWHFPLMLLTPVYPILGTWLIIGPVFLLTLTFAGVFYGYLQLTSKSVWPATLAHGAINACLNTFFLYTVTDSPVTLEYLATEKGVVMLAATALSAGWLIFRLRQHRSLPAVQMPASA